MIYWKMRMSEFLEGNSLMGELVGIQYRSVPEKCINLRLNNY